MPDVLAPRSPPSAAAPVSARPTDPSDGVNSLEISGPSIRRFSDEQFQSVMERERGVVLAVVRAKVGDREMHEDLVQETFMRLLSPNAPALDAPGLRYWLLRVVTNLVIDYYRSCDRRPAALASPMELDCVHSGRAEDLVERQELNAQIVAAVDALPPRQSSVARLTVLHGATYDEAAELLGEKRIAVKNRVQAALIDLRRRLAAG